MINIIFGCLASSIVMLSYGLIFNQAFFKEDTKRINYYEIGIFGFIFVGFLSLIINFFIPLIFKEFSIDLAIHPIESQETILPLLPNPGNAGARTLKFFLKYLI